MTERLDGFVCTAVFIEFLEGVLQGGINTNLNTRVFGQQFLAILTIALLLIMGPGGIAIVNAQEAAAPPPAKIPNDQLDSLVAPIALHPDPLLAQMLAASTYPLEIVQLQQWLLKNKDLKDKALADAVMKQNWDASVQAMAALPDAVKQLSENIKWTTDLGNAFLAQQGDVMDAVQRMRGKAQSSGMLKSSEQQKVETKVVENKTVVVIEQTNPQVVYVPSYNPVVVYGAPVYPYPPVYYPYGAAVASAAIGFGVGMAMGAAWGGGWGYNAGWGGGNNNININNNNTFVNNSNRNNVSGGNRNNVNSGNRGGNSSWQHNPQHRGGTPYSNKATADKFGGSDRASAANNRQTSARQNQAGAGDRGSASNRQQPSASNRSAGGGGGSADRVGNRSASPSASSSRSSGAFGGGSSGYSGSSARSSSSRGSSSMSSRGGGGGASRGGGGGRRR